MKQRLEHDVLSCLRSCTSAWNLSCRQAVLVAANTGEDNAPIIDLHTAENPVRAGRRVRLVCDAFGRPRPEFSWLRDGRPLLPERRRRRQQLRRNESDSTDSPRSAATTALDAPVSLREYS